MSNSFQTISPVDGSIYIKRPFANDRSIEQALTLAMLGYQEWKNTSIQQRAILCKRAVQYFLDHATAIGEELSWQMGRPIRYSPMEISGGFKERAVYMIDEAEAVLKDVKLKDKAGFMRFIRRTPLGLVLVLAPWNYPYLTSVNTIIPALMAGNVVILKHAQQTALCAERYAKALCCCRIT